MPEKLSVLIPTLNEEENIRSCIESVRDIADEILVFDSFSLDHTVEIARSLGARVEQRKFDNYSAQKNAALQMLRNEWVLNLDADERLTPDLRSEIAGLLKDNASGAAAYAVPRHAIFNNRRLRCWSTRSTVRLFRRSNAHYDPNRSVHEHLIVNGPIGRLLHPILHYSFRSVAQYMPKVEQFTTLSAADAMKNGERAGLVKLLLYPPARFVKAYFFRGGILDGVPGILIAWLSAYSTYLKYAKLRHLAHK
jgi:glycosyltransferase involved in cell wall biosynthesis